VHETLRAFRRGRWLRLAPHALSLLASFVLAAPLAAAVPALIPNAQKYADKRPVATGRSGSAALTARALIGKDDRTVLELTTGSLDSDQSPSGTIARAQVKGIAPSGEAVNYNDLDSGYVSFAYDDLRRGQPLQVQANVRGVDAARTDVITVSDVVLARPDLAVGQLSSPAKAVARAPVNISAVISEGNGDVGARADCVLYVDEAEVDRARGIWVDKGDAVSCAFTHFFDAPGERSLRVAAADVVPGDWDLDNNSAAGSIDVVEAYDRVEASFSEEEYADIFTSRGSSASDNSAYEYQNRWGPARWTQVATYRGYVYPPVTFPIQVDATIGDGTQVSTAHFADVTPTHVAGGAEGWCYNDWKADDSGARTVHLFTGACSTWGGRTFTIVHVQREAGVVTYFSEGFSRGWYRSGSQVITYDYQYNQTSTWVGGTQRLTGPVLSMNVRLDTGTVAYERPVDVVINDGPSSDWGYEYCFPLTWGQYCSGRTGYSHLRSGSAIVGAEAP
jgi:hypothetical protein